MLILRGRSYGLVYRTQGAIKWLHYHVKLLVGWSPSSRSSTGIITQKIFACLQVNSLQYVWTSIQLNSLSQWTLLSSRSWMSKFCINSPFTNFSLGLTSYSNQVISSFFLQPGLVIFQTGQKCFYGKGWLAIAKLKPLSLFISLFQHCQMLS